MAAQFKNVQKVGGVYPCRGHRSSLTGAETEQENEALESQIREYERRISEFENAAKDEGQSNKLIYEELERIRIRRTC